MNFGLVGAGCIGKIRARALADASGCELSAVFDPAEDRARALADAHDISVAGHFDRLIERGDLDAVIVSSPPPFHEEQAIAALEADKHVLCEKPLSNSVESCRRMVEAARTNGNTLATGFNHRYFPAVQFVKDTLDKGLIGELDHVRAFAGHEGLSEFRSSWEYDSEVVGGGALMDVGIHLIDLTRYLLGDVESVYGTATNNIWDLNGSEDNGIAVLRSPEGPHALLQATWGEWKGYRFHVDVYGTNGMARAYYAPMFGMRITMDEPGGEKTRSMNFYPKTFLMEKLQGWQWTVERTFRREIEDFLRYCDGHPEPLASGFAGFRAVEVAHAVYQCTRDREPVPLTPPF